MNMTNNVTVIVEQLCWVGRDTATGKDLYEWQHYETHRNQVSVKSFKLLHPEYHGSSTYRIRAGK